MMSWPVSASWPTRRGSDSSSSARSSVIESGSIVLGQRGAARLLLAALLRRFAKLHVGPEASREHVDRQAGLRIVAEALRAVGPILQQLERLLQREVGRRDVVRDRGVGVAHLRVRAIAADADDDLLPDGGIDAEFDDRVLDAVLVGHEVPQARPVVLPVVELLEELRAIEVAVGDLVEVLLDTPGEAEFDELAEVVLQQARHGERRVARHQRLALPPHVAATLDGLDDRRVRRRASDAVFLERLHERRVGVSRRRQRLVRLRIESGERERPLAWRRHAIADRELGQQRLLVAEFTRRGRHCPRRRRAGSRRTGSPCRWR